MLLGNMNIGRLTEQKGYPVNWKENIHLLTGAPWLEQEKRFTQINLLPDHPYVYLYNIQDIVTTLTGQKLVTTLTGIKSQIPEGYTSKIIPRRKCWYIQFAKPIYIVRFRYTKIPQDNWFVSHLFSHAIINPLAEYHYWLDSLANHNIGKESIILQDIL